LWLEPSFFIFLQTTQTSNALHDQEIESLTQQIQSEIQARKILEDTILKERQLAETRERDALNQVDNVNMDFQMALAAKQTAELKSTTLSEQKKILVKEVKQLRKKIEEISESMEVLKSANERLSSAVMMQPDGSTSTSQVDEHENGHSSGTLSTIAPYASTAEASNASSTSPMFFTAPIIEGNTSNGIFDKFSRSFRNETKFLTKFYDNIKMNFS
jgi:DNA repair exonuclease SbcCD ATPase subunit